MILRKEGEGLWLSDQVLSNDDIQRLFESYPSRLMESYPVSADVNNVRNNSDKLVLPI